MPVASARSRGAQSTPREPRFRAPWRLAAAGGAVLAGGLLWLAIREPAPAPTADPAPAPSHEDPARGATRSAPPVLPAQGQRSRGGSAVAAAPPVLAAPRSVSAPTRPARPASSSPASRSEAPEPPWDYASEPSREWVRWYLEQWFAQHRPDVRLERRTLEIAIDYALDLDRARQALFEAQDSELDPERLAELEARVQEANERLLSVSGIGGAEIPRG